MSTADDSTRDAREVRERERERALKDQAVAEYLESAPAHFLRCRKWRHAWEPTHAHLADGEYLVEGSGRERVYVEDLTCMRCKTRRIDQRAPRTYELVRRHYEYVEGFLAEGVVVPATAVRVAEAKQRAAQTRKERAAQRRHLAVAG